MSFLTSNRAKTMISAGLSRKALALLALTAALLLGGVLFAGAGANAASGILKVFITNDAANPVPVNGSVAVSNTGDDPVPVNGQVGVSGTVNVADDRETFERRIDLVEFGTSVAGGSFQVPEGKRLVVEFVSARVNVPSGQTPLLSANASTGATGFAIPIELQGVGNGNAFFAGATPVLDFAAPGSFYSVSLERQLPGGGLPTGSAGGFVYVSGYLIPAS
jgi:hypothetical protein